MTKRCALTEDPAEYWALIEGPTWADTGFYGNWLLAAAKANELWTEALKNPRFSERVDQWLSYLFKGTPVLAHNRLEATCFAEFYSYAFAHPVVWCRWK